MMVFLISERRTIIQRMNSYSHLHTKNKNIFVMEGSLKMCLV